MITKRAMTVLKLLSRRPTSAIELSDSEISDTQNLTRQGLAYDYAAFRGRRMEVRLRLWGITEAGRAVLLQQNIANMTAGRDRQLGLILQKAREKGVPQKGDSLLK